MENILSIDISGLLKNFLTLTHSTFTMQKLRSLKSTFYLRVDCCWFKEEVSCSLSHSFIFSHSPFHSHIFQRRAIGISISTLYLLVCSSTHSSTSAQVNTHSQVFWSKKFETNKMKQQYTNIHTT